MTDAQGLETAAGRKEIGHKAVDHVGGPAVHGFEISVELVFGRATCKIRGRGLAGTAAAAGELGLQLPEVARHLSDGGR
jgi:hypothetical protein